MYNQHIDFYLFLTLFAICICSCNNQVEPTLNSKNRESGYLDFYNETLSVDFGVTDLQAKYIKYFYSPHEEKEYLVYLSNDKNELLLFELESKKLFAFEVPFSAGQVDDYKIVSTDSIFFLQKRTSVVYLTHSNSTDDSIKKFEIINEYELQSILDSIFDEEMYLSCYSPLYPLDYKDGRLF